MAEALVGGAFLSAFLQVLFDRMASRKFLDFFRGQKLSDDLLRKLKIALLSGNAVLEDAQEKELTNLTVREWVDELFNAVYDADDILDEITTNSLQGTQVQTDVKKVVKDSLPSEGDEVCKNCYSVPNLKIFLKGIQHLTSLGELWICNKANYAQVLARRGAACLPFGSGD